MEREQKDHVGKIFNRKRERTMITEEVSAASFGKREKKKGDSTEGQKPLILKEPTRERTKGRK